MEEERRKKGRPKKNNAKQYHHSIRLSEEDEKILKYYLDKTGDSINDIIKNCLKRTYFRDKLDL